MRISRRSRGVYVTVLLASVMSIPFFQVSAATSSSRAAIFPAPLGTDWLDHTGRWNFKIIDVTRTGTPRFRGTCPYWSLVDCEQLGVPDEYYDRIENALKLIIYPTENTFCRPIYDAMLEWWENSPMWTFEEDTEEPTTVGATIRDPQTGDVTDIAVRLDIFAQGTIWDLRTVLFHEGAHLLGWGEFAAQVAEGC